MNHTSAKVLVIDPDPGNSLLLQKSIGTNDETIDIQFLDSLKEGMLFLQKHQVDLVFISEEFPEAEWFVFQNNIHEIDAATSMVVILNPAKKNTASKDYEKRGIDSINIQYVGPALVTIISHKVQVVRRLTDELNNRTKNAFQKEEKIFLGEISHKIRNPLNSIIGFSAAMLKTNKNEEEREFLGAIKTSGEDILKVIDEKLNITGYSNYVPDSHPFTQRPLTTVHFAEIMKLKILLVEDDMFNIKLVEHLFSEYGMKADIALNGKFAIEKIALNKYDLVLMDMEMPEMDGYTATRYTRNELQNQVPIIALTANALEGEREKCMEAGMNEYMTKPINANRLFEIIYRTVKPKEERSVEQAESFINLKPLKESMSGKRKAIKEMLDFFIKQIPEQLSALKIAIGKKEQPAITRLVQKMKSTILLTGIKKADPLLTELDNLVQSDSSKERIDTMHTELTSLMRQAVGEMAIEKNKL